MVCEAGENILESTANILKFCSNGCGSEPCRGNGARWGFTSGEQQKTEPEAASGGSVRDKAGFRVLSYTNRMCSRTLYLAWSAILKLQIARDLP